MATGRTKTTSTSASAGSVFEDLLYSRIRDLFTYELGNPVSDINVIVNTSVVEQQDANVSSIISINHP